MIAHKIILQITSDNNVENFITYNCKTEKDELGVCCKDGQRKRAWILGLGFRNVCKNPR